MDSQDLITGVRWELLKRISQKPQTGADLAKEIQTTAANVSQHLKLLELAGLVIKERVNGKSVHYRIAGELALITHLCEKPVRETIELDSIESLQLRLFMDKKPKTKYLRGFLCIYEDLVRSFTAFGMLKDEGEELQLLVLSDDVKALRKEYANIHIGGKKVVIWSHTPGEFKDGLGRKEHYFTDMVKRLSILYDPHHTLQKLVEEQQ